MPVSRRARKDLTIEVKSEDPPAQFPPSLLESFRFQPQGKARAQRANYSGAKHATQRRTNLQCDVKPFTAETAKAGGRLKSFQAVEALKQDEAEGEEEEEILPPVPDLVREGCDILVIGSNPGRQSSRSGHHFAHPSNHFYKALHLSGLTPVRVAPQDDAVLLHQPPPYYSIGLTNLASRPSRLAEELSASENANGAKVLIDLVRQHKPTTGIFIGLGVGRAFVTAIRNSDKLAERREVADERRVVLSIPKRIPTITDSILGKGVGLMAVAIGHADDAEIGKSARGLATGLTSIGATLLLSIPSTSGRVTTHQLKDKAECMATLKVLLDQSSEIQWRNAEASVEYSEGKERSDDRDDDHFKLFEVRVIQALDKKRDLKYDVTS